MKLVCNLLITLASYLDLFFAHDISLLRVKTDKIKYDEVAISVTKRKLFGSYINKIMEILITTNISSIKFAFVIITLVQFMVVTKGSERVAEVAARFTLDALPGKQMSIDADLNAGLLDADQAKTRRELLSKEYNFFELTKVIGKNDLNKTLEIVSYMSKNSKKYPVPLIVATVYSFFNKLFVYHSIENKKEASKILGINPYFIEEYHQASAFYPMKRISKIFDYLLEADKRSKGINFDATNSEAILNDLVYKIFTIT